MFQCLNCQSKLKDDELQCPKCGCKVQHDADGMRSGTSELISAVIEDTVDLDRDTSVERSVRALDKVIVDVDSTPRPLDDETTDIPLGGELPDATQNAGQGGSEVVNEPAQLDQANLTISFDKEKTLDLDSLSKDVADTAGGSQEDMRWPVDETADLGEPNEVIASDQTGTLGYTSPLFPISVRIAGDTSSPDQAMRDNSDTVDLGDVAEQEDITIEFGTEGHGTSGQLTVDGKAQGTVSYTTDELAAAHGDTGKSGSSGHLRRVWGGVESFVNPTSTLKAVAAKASDSVFERVSPRILVSNNQSEIIDVARARAKDKDKDQMVVRECLQNACLNDTTMSDYQINGYLGRGAMGVVLQARQSAIGRDVAIKMIQPSAGGSRTTSTTRDLQKKFLYEAQITGKLDHPNIVPIYELGISNNILFYAMKKIVGSEWKASIGKLSKDENLDILMKVADAMALSHQRDIIHRDLKPENIMLGPFGEVLVTDWGCAIDLSLKENFSGAGSPPWMAPEMALHQKNVIGPRSDIYLLGAILYQIVAGFPPHGGKTVMEVLLAASRNQILPTKKTDPLLKIALKAMATDPVDRYATVEELQTAIRQYRKHAESIALTDRSLATLEAAMNSKDYERFSRSIFGFRDALELWSENSMASDGLKQARLALGQCAFERKDYDLCLATIDRQNPEEDSLYVQAETAKQALVQREIRFKTMRKVLAAVVLIGLASSSIAAGVAWFQKLEADRQRKIAVQQTVEADAARVEAERQEVIAKNEKKIADDAKVEAERQEGIAKAEKMLADEAKVEAERQEGIAKAEKILADNAKIEAERQEGIAKAEKVLADKARLESQRRAAEVELAGIQSNLALALGQVEQLDIDRVRQTLVKISDERSYVSLASQGIPRLKNWAWNRVNLLSNSDLLQQPLGQSVSAMAFSQQVNKGVVAIVRDGMTSLQIVSVQRQQLVSDAERLLDLGTSSVESAAISPDGRQVLFSLMRQENNQPRLYRWDIDSPTGSPVVEAESRAFQGFVATNALDVAGLNRGLWVWSRSQLNETPNRIEGVQGRLLSIQSLDDYSVLVLAEMPNGGRYPHVISLREPGTHRFLRTQSALGIERLSAVAYANDKLVLGTESGRMFTLPFALDSVPPNSDGDRGVSLEAKNMSEIPQKHFARIRSIRTHADGTLLSVAEEPIVHVWKPVETEYGWRHDIQLAGTTSNVMRADFVASSELVLAIAEDARPIVWDVYRQRQRQLARRISPEGVAEVYDAPVVNVVTSSDGRRAVSILENGKVDRWDVQTGLIDHQGETPLSYIGHHPDAQFVDMAIDIPAGVMITSARLPTQNGQTRQVLDAQTTDSEVQWDWEFVKWDLNNLQMNSRWGSRSSEEQAVSIAGQGRYLLYGSDSQTRIQDLHGQQNFQRDDFGAFFGVAHPTAKSLMMLVKLNGAVMLADVDNPAATWKKPGYRLSERDFAQIATNGDRPVIGRWSPMGNRFYLAWESGRITELAWENQSLSILRDSESDGSRLDLSFKIAADLEAAPISSRVGSRWDIDMKVRTEHAHNLVYVLVRFPGREGLTRLTRLAFPLDSGNVLRSQDDALLEFHHCVLSDDVIPQAVTLPLTIARTRLPKIESQVAATRAVGQYTFVATKFGVIHRVNSNSQAVHVFGATKILSGTGDHTGNRIATLHEGGLVWRADWINGNWQWRQLPMVSAVARQIAMSPDGSQIALCTDSDVKLISAESGIEHASIPSISAIVQWDRSSDPAKSRLAMVDASGQIQLIEGGKPRAIGKIPADSFAKGIHFFRESWNDPNQGTENWLLVHATTGNHDVLFYVHEDPQQSDKNCTLELTGKISKIECSPTEGLIAAGSYGAVAIYFAAPTLGEAGKQLFGLPGHAGAEVKLLHFTSDGKTMLTGDSSSRLLGWLSEDLVSKVLPEQPD